MVIIGFSHPSSIIPISGSNELALTARKPMIRSSNKETKLTEAASKEKSVSSNTDEYKGMK